MHTNVHKARFYDRNNAFVCEFMPMITSKKPITTAAFMFHCNVFCNNKPLYFVNKNNEYIPVENCEQGLDELCAAYGCSTERFMCIGTR